MNETSRQDEIERNLEFFLREMANIPPECLGKVALLRHQKIEGYYDTVADAVNAGNMLYRDMLFSVQKVTNSPINLGGYSYALSVGAS